MPKTRAKKQSEVYAVELDNDREDWMRFSLTAWSGAFGDNEPKYTFTKPKRGKFKFDWEGELSDLAEEFSSLDAG